MQFDILYQGPFSTLQVDLELNEAIKAESGAMVAMDRTLAVEGKMEGGLLGGLGRMMAGETFFFQTIAARQGAGRALLAPRMIGEIFPLSLNGDHGYILAKDGFFAGTRDVEISTKMQNLTKGLFSGEGFFVLKASGTGTLFVSAYGSIHPVDLSENQEIIIDTGHLVAWPDYLNYKIQKASAGWISSFTSGEGLVCSFTGPGRVLIQTRNPGSLGAWLRQFLPVK